MSKSIDHLHGFSTQPTLMVPLIAIGTSFAAMIWATSIDAYSPPDVSCLQGEPVNGPILYLGAPNTIAFSDRALFDSTIAPFSLQRVAHQD